MMVAWRARLQSRRGMRAQAEIVVRSLLFRAPRPVQRLVVSSLDVLVRRWPGLAWLSGIAAKTIAPEPMAPESIEPPESRVETALPSSRDESLECLRACNDSVARAFAARALSHVVDRETTVALVIALRDPMAEVAVEAALALRFHPAEFAAPALRHVLENRDRYFSPTTRAAAVRTLGALLPAGQAAPVAAAVADVDASVSLAAVAALAERDEPDGAEVLLALLEDASGFYVPLTRQAAARALSQMGYDDEGRIDALLGREADSTVREALSSVRLRAS
jgi:hypothetical protein